MEAIETTTPIHTLLNSRLSNSFGDVIRRQRTKLGLSQDQVGQRVGLSFWNIKQFERGIETPTSATRNAIATVLGLNVNELRALPMTDVPIGARRREGVELVASTLEFVPTSPSEPIPAPLHNYLHVIVSHGEADLRTDTNLRLAMIDAADGVVGSVSVMADEGAHWFTTAIHYRATHDLFDGTDPDGETTDRSVPTDPFRLSRTRRRSSDRGTGRGST